jgi:type I restriction enzyme S subunit
MSKDKLIPELRFPEFLEKEGWEIKEVGEIFQVTRGYVLSMTLVKELPTEDYPYPVFSSQTKNNGLAGYYNEYLYEDAITWTTDGANAGDVNYRDGKFYCTNVCGVLLNEEGIANPCIAELINSVSKKHVSYVGNPKLMNGVMSKIQIPVPSIKEQQKIASCLSSLDELIAAHKDKLDALKDHKKGLLQNLFPQEGETVPKVRFPEFEDVGEWEERTIEDIVIAESSTLALNKLNLKSNGYPIYGADGIIGYIDDFQQIDKYISIVKDGSGVGRLALCEGKSSILGTLQYLKSRNPEDYDLTWVYYLLNTVNFSSFIKGSGIPHIYYSDYKNENIALPSLPEQQKIASCLSSLDEAIERQAEKIEQLKMHKKGLMQGLFPSAV